MCFNSGWLFASVAVFGCELLIILFMYVVYCGVCVLCFACFAGFGRVVFNSHISFYSFSGCFYYY